MADDKISKIVTAFRLNTCRLPQAPWPTVRDIQAAICCADTKQLECGDEEAELISLKTGSVAEFYVEPMLQHVGDIDVMYYNNTQLAIPRGHPPPTQLPAEFNKYVKVHEIIDSHLPGYVYLQLRYLLTQCTEDGNYKYVEYDDRQFLSNHTYYNGDEKCIHGPAIIIDLSNDPSHLSVDNVFCVRCLSWPPQASDWPTRHRNYGWPDSATLDRVVSMGCDMVGVAHRQCRQYEWMSKHQQRLSFSRAEIVLINSWMPVQQIVYHILRYFIKTEQLIDCADNSGAGTLNNYHIKTLMLWACELKPRSWRTENLNVVRICVELLHTLSVWLTDTRCPHYFINNCNLLDNSFNVGSAANKLMSVDEEYLSTWFVNNYIRQCAHLCPHYVVQLFNDISTAKKLQNAVSAIVNWRLNTSLHDLWPAVVFAEGSIPLLMPRLPFNVRSYVYLMNELTKIDERLSVYFLAVALLHVASKISRNGFRDELMDVLFTILGRNLNQCCSILSLRNTMVNRSINHGNTELNTPVLVELLQKSAIEHLTTFRQFEARDFDSVATVVTTDFEALYTYKRGDYQRCLLLSTQNVRTLLDGAYAPRVSTSSDFIQLLDDDIVSLIALIEMVNPKCRGGLTGYEYNGITQVTLSLYLMTQCQLKLGYYLMSPAQTLFYIKFAQRTHPPTLALDQLTLKLIERKTNRTS